MRKNGGIFKNKVEEDIEMKIYHAQVNHLENPMGFRMERTVFSWKVKDAEGKKQSYARIRVASDAAMEHLLFDSGEDDKASSLFYPVKLDLEPRTRYYWNVEAGSDAGETAVSEVQFFETGKRNEAWTGKWISCDSKENRHPYFEKEIVPAKEVAKARLYVCGLGLYEVYVDEKRVGDEYLTPYSNDYNEWVQYQTYDVTEEVSKQGMLRVLLGNGWYKARFGFSAFEDKGFYGNEWKLIAELHLTYADGSEEVIGTDESWQVRRSKIAFSNLYDGEHRDDTLSEPVSYTHLDVYKRQELNRMISANTGQRYWIMTRKIFFLRKRLSPWMISSSIFATPMTLETRRQVAMAAIGIITEFVRKSKKSRNCMPRMVTEENGP